MIGLFRRISGCSAEQIILGNPFRTIPWKRKMLGILYSVWTKTEAISRNSIRNHSAEEKIRRNFVLCNKYRRKLSGFVPNHSGEEKTTWNSVPWKKNKSKLSEFRSETFDDFILLSYFGCFSKLIFSAYFRSVPSFGIESFMDLEMPRNEHFLPRNKGNHSKSIPRNFFKRNSVVNPSFRPTL